MVPKSDRLWTHEAHSNIMSLYPITNMHVVSRKSDQTYLSPSPHRLWTWRMSQGFLRVDV